MDAHIIEKMDKQRYNAVILQTLGLLIMLIETSAGYIANWNIIGTYLSIGWFIGPPLFIAGWIWGIIVKHKIDRNPEVKAALNNELHVSYKYRSQRVAFRVTMATLVIMLIASSWYLIVNTPETRLNIQPPIICEMAIFIGLSTLKISWLVYNRK